MISESSLPRHYLFSCILAVVFLFLISGMYIAQAAPLGLPTASVELDGYLWSDNIGWVSLNCKTGGIDDADADLLPEDICGVGVGQSNYRVVMNDATGDVTGWAWSNNVGWIKFDGLSGFPPVASNPGTSAQSAKVIGNAPTNDINSGLTLRGWVRACSGTINPSVCTNMTNSAVSGGWDGWISLRGTSGGTTADMTYGVAIDSLGNVSGTSYGWGKTVVGWVEFALMKLLLPTATLSGTPCTIARDASTCANGTISWTFIDAAVATRDIARTSPTVDTSIDDPAPGTLPSITGTDTSVTLELGANLFRAYYTYPGSPIGNQLSLTAGCGPNDSAYPAPASKCDQAMPTITITADKKVVRLGDVVNISWTITPPAAEVLDSSIVCNVYGPGMPAAAQTTNGTANSLAIKNGSSFKIVCTPPGGAGANITDSVSVGVVPTTQEM